MAITTYVELKEVLRKNMLQLTEIPVEYLSETGKAALEAYKDVLWCACFHDTFKSLSEDEEFKNLTAKEDKDTEYHRVVRKVKRFLERNS